MKLVCEAKASTFADLPHGSIFVGSIRDGLEFRAIKARIGGADFFVTIGPMLPDDKGCPGAYANGPLGIRAVLDISAVCSFVPSSAPDDVLGDWTEGLGLAFLTPSGHLLGIRVWTGGGAWEGGYLNLETGEISSHLPAGTVIVTKNWSLITSTDKDRTVLFRYRAQQ